MARNGAWHRDEQRRDNLSGQRSDIVWQHGDISCGTATGSRETASRGAGVIASGEIIGGGGVSISVSADQ